MGEKTDAEFVEKLTTSQVTSVDRTSCNVWKFTFRDGEVFEVWAEVSAGLPFIYTDKGEQP